MDLDFNASWKGVPIQNVSKAQLEQNPCSTPSELWDPQLIHEN